MYTICVVYMCVCVCVSGVLCVCMCVCMCEAHTHACIPYVYHIYTTAAWLFSTVQCRFQPMSNLRHDALAKYHAYAGNLHAQNSNLQKLIYSSKGMQKMS